MSGNRVTVYGAYGHTGRFVVAELLRRGFSPILSGRDGARLAALATAYPGLETRPAAIDDPASLDGALDGAAAVVNCAGPFVDTAAPVIEAALRARIHYLDVTPEQQVVLATFERFAERAREAGIAILPAMAFYGGLADLLATAAMGDWVTGADEIRIGVALDSWHPTPGTRATGHRNTARRLVVSNHRLDFLPDPPPTRTWEFPAPFGAQEAVALPLAEIVTISRHLKAREVHSYMNLAPLKDLRNPDTPPPQATDEAGRSAQTFAMDVIVKNGTAVRRATACGRDIYAITAPLVVAALERIVDGRTRRLGVVAAGEVFDAREFLASLRPDGLSFALAGA